MRSPDWVKRGVSTQSWGLKLCCRSYQKIITSSKGALKYSQHAQYGGVPERRIYEDEVGRGRALLERHAFDRGSSCTVWYPSALWSSDSQVYQHNTGGAPLCFIYVLGIVCMREVMQEGKSYRNNSLLACSKPSCSLIGHRYKCTGKAGGG